MNNRERILAVLNYEKYDRMPVVHFGFWRQVLEKWYQEGHLTKEEAQEWYYGSKYDDAICKKLGFDSRFPRMFGGTVQGLMPRFEEKVIEVLADGTKKMQNKEGVIVLQREGAGSIPAEVDHLLKDRESWEEHYLPKLQYHEDRIDRTRLEAQKDDPAREALMGIHCGSLFGWFRNMAGVVGTSYIFADDEDLYDEIINTLGELSFQMVKNMLATGVKFDFAHFWEDICFKNGPLVTPSVFYEKVGPHYKRICDLLNQNGTNIVSVDCDGMIDSLIPTWLENGVNTMFPIEVGTWGASIAPWREKYGRELRGVGGMNKNIFELDYRAVDEEIERLKPLIALGGYIPCPDHFITPDAKWENVQYYCEKLRNISG